MKLINKNALVAEIEKRKIIAREKAEIASDNSNVPVAALWSGKENICIELLSLIDTLEVKEVDLEKEIELIKGDYEQVDVAWNNDFDYIARNFFELGLKAQKGE